jgi:hypothetical protein
MLTEADLNPCSHCGCDPVHVWVDELCEGVWVVKCNVCLSRGPECEDKELAIGRWNERATTSRTTARPAAVGWICPRCGKALAPWVEACGCGGSGVWTGNPPPRLPEAPWIGDPIVRPSVTGDPPPMPPVTVCGTEGRRP